MVTVEDKLKVRRIRSVLATEIARRKELADIARSLVDLTNRVIALINDAAIPPDCVNMVGKPEAQIRKDSMRSLKSAIADLEKM